MREPNAPATRFQAVSLSGGTVTFNPPARSMTIGVGGVINMRAPGMAATALTNVLPAGFLPCECMSITPTGTTAADITVFW